MMYKYPVLLVFSFKEANAFFARGKSLHTPDDFPFAIEIFSIQGRRKVKNIYEYAVILRH